MQKVYSRINWENEPSTNTAINEDNLNKMDYALDQLDNRVVSLFGYEERAKQSETKAGQYAANAKTSEINAKNSEDNAKQSELKAKEYMENAFKTTPEGYQALTEQVELLDIKTTTDSTLQNSKAGGLKLNHMSGNTEQKSYSGKNLYDVQNVTLKSDNATVDTDDYVTMGYDNTQSTYARYLNLFTGFNPLLKENTTYTIVVEIAKFDGVGAQLYVTSTNGAECGQFGDFAIENTVGTLVYKRITKASFENIPTCLRTFLKVPIGVNASIKFRISILEDTTVTADTFVYEPYVGNQQSPNPSYPQVIENVGDCVEMKQGYYDSSGAYVSSDTSMECSKNILPCVSGDAIELELEHIGAVNIVYFNGTSYLKSMGAVADKVSVTHTVPSGATGFRVQKKKTVGKITLTVNGKYVVPIPNKNKNLAKLYGVGTSWGYTERGIKNLRQNNGNTLISYRELRLKAGKTYTVSVKMISKPTSGTTFTAYSNGVELTDISYVNIHSYTLEKVYTKKFTPTEDCAVNYIMWGNANSDIFEFTFQIEEGEATPYERYTEHTEYIYLNEPFRATDRVVEVDGVFNENHKRTTVVFDGSDDEVITYKENSNAPMGGYFYATLPKKSVAYDDKTMPNILCTHLIPMINKVANYQDNGITIDSTGGRILIASYEVTDVATAKAWLQANPITVEYELEEETFTPLDTESQKALNRLKTFDTVTYLEVDSVVQPSEVEVQYGTSKVGALALYNEQNQKLEQLDEKWTEVVNKTGTTTLKIPRKGINDIYVSVAYSGSTITSTIMIEQISSNGILLCISAGIATVFSADVSFELDEQDNVIVANVEDARFGEIDVTNDVALEIYTR